MRFIVLQPDGRLAVYSTVASGLVLHDATPDEVADDAADFVGRVTSPNATPEQTAARVKEARETARRHATFVLDGEPHRAYKYPMSWQDVEAMAAAESEFH